MHQPLLSTLSVILETIVRLHSRAQSRPRKLWRDWRGSAAHVDACITEKSLGKSGEPTYNSFGLLPAADSLMRHYHVTALFCIITVLMAVWRGNRCSNMI